MSGANEEESRKRLSGAAAPLLTFVSVALGLFTEVTSRYLETHHDISHASSHFMTLLAIIILASQPFVVVFTTVRILSVRICLAVGIFLVALYHVEGGLEALYPSLFVDRVLIESIFQPFSVPIGFGLILLALYFTLVNMSNAQVDLRRERKRLLQEILERKRAEEIIREREAQYRALLDNTGTGYVVVDAGGRVLDANAEYVRMTGHHELKDIQGRLVTDWIVPVDQDRIIQEFRKCFEQGTVRSLEVSCLGGEADTETAVEMSAMVIERKQGPLVLALCRDIDARKKAEAELLRSSRMAALGVMAAGLAHEIGNPLASLSTRLSLLAEEDTTPFVKESIEILQKQISRIAQIVHGVSRFSRPREQGLVECNVNTLVTETFDIVRFHEKAWQCRLATEFSHHPPMVMARPDQLIQVFLNLGINALEAMPEGGSLMVQTSLSNGSVVIRFVDTGTGFNPDLRNRIFDTFYTSKTDGLGLGLSIAHNIVSMHGGHIEAANNPEGGACFSVFLPAQHAAIPLTDARTKSIL